MFYCDYSADKRGWQESILSIFYGSCEICKKVGECNDVPSKYLPTPKMAGEVMAKDEAKTPAEEEKEVKTSEQNKSSGWVKPKGK